ncbi:hypothetical protein ACTFSB_28635 [Bacillus cereus group sp. MYBK14-3]|uniref:hypothetical protein n=1 Tax=unclassified Bacillus cereus group TaxID=2750818 RepID=UPI003F78DF64
MNWEVVGVDNNYSPLNVVNKGDKIKIIDRELNLELSCVVYEIGCNTITLTNKEAIKTIEIDGKQIPFAYGMIWLEDGSEVYSKEGNFKEHDYYRFEFESIKSSLLLEVSLRSKVGVNAKVITQSNKVIKGVFICDSYSGGDDQMNEYELRQLQ